jgi:hypothetical protein
MGNALQQQGVLNRLRSSIVFDDFTELNITAPFLGEEGINLSLEGDVTENLATMTGTVTSPAPYQMATVEIHLLKSQSFADQWKQQIESNSVLGDFTIFGDASTLGNYQILNGNIASAGPGRLNGKSVDFVVTLRGYYSVNSSLYGQ